MGTNVPDSKIILPLFCGGNALYIAWMGGAKDVVIDLGEHFVKQSLRNRMLLDGPNGILTITFPVASNPAKRESSGEVRLYDEKRWKQQNWKSICSCYGSAPYFVDYSQDLQSLFEKKHNLLALFNIELCELLLQWLGYNSSFTISQTYVESKDGDLDYRISFPPMRSNPYLQVFSDRHRFIEGLSILDLLFNLGPAAKNHSVVALPDNAREL
jgi:hypothetical protein